MFPLSSYPHALLCLGIRFYLKQTEVSTETWKWKWPTWWGQHLHFGKGFFADTIFVLLLGYKNRAGISVSWLWALQKLVVRFLLNEVKHTPYSKRYWLQTGVWLSQLSGRTMSFCCISKSEPVYIHSIPGSSVSWREHIILTTAASILWEKELKQ